MSKVLITGASGLLGYNTALECCRHGLEVRVLVRKSSNTNLLNGLFCEVYYGSIENGAEVLTAVKDCDYVVHTASLTEQWGKSREDYEQVNIRGTEHIIQACLHHGVKRLVYISTANTMAPGSLKQPGTELNSFSLFRINSPYINTKYIAQQKVLEAVVERQLPAVVLNPTFMIGAHDLKPSSGQILKYAMNKWLLFCPPGGKNFVHVRDVSRAIVEACTQGANGDCLLIAGENLSYREFFRIVNRLAQQNPVMLRIPRFILKIGGLLGTALGKITGKRLKLNYASAYLLCLDNYYSGQKAARALGLTYTPVTTAVEEALDWFQKNNNSSV
ncbi:NAD-dependent epimerase/dehydratase family protein [Niabella beijingensis]|uniref:NAD-dependent epimerase/dehydratase family protein n=1 Tax=Niabella beijingensis TaxID=2872700 RepID=UPI001CBC23CC|nr:NAD-dependent epimerase/dehydratase family protein [Niabella beijingensis]MBZ4192378.1 NAD-dependent epimerase/dehydratase family protein [Niabella beijingensis]